MKRYLRLLVLVVASAATLALTSCSEFASPSELSRPQVLGLRVDPAQLAPGQRGRLTSLVAGPDGPVAIEPTWSVDAADAADAAIEVDADGSWLRVADETSATELALDASFATSDGVMRASRHITIASGADPPRDNPVIDGIRVDGQLADSVRLSVGQIAALDLDVAEPAALDASATVAWYATRGEIERYHVASSEIEATVAGEGFLFVVCRDGLGGIDWRQVPLIIEEAP